MERKVGTVVSGIRMPIIKEGDDLATLVTDNVLNALPLKNRDVIAITESIVARAQGNYCTVDDIATDLKNKFNCDTIGIIFPILSRNRFSILLKGIARAFKKVIVMLSYPSDEVGNSFLTYDDLDEKGINPYTDVFTKDEFVKLFGHPVHQFTGVDYVAYYEELIKGEGAEAQIIFANQATAILKFTNNVLCCDIHSRFRSKRLLKAAGAKVLGMDDIMTSSINGSGFNKDYGLLGSNKSTEEKVKLFPRDSQGLVEEIQSRILNKTGVYVEVMVYGDGAFKDPQGKIWELADPIVSPFHTKGLIGTPNEIKLKYLADNDFASLKGEELKKAIVESIKTKEANLVGNMASQGTTPRQITDLLGSLCDLTSGSGDKGTPVIVVSGYFDNYTND